MPADRSFAAALGPGILFAGTAIGVSHLVQSTRAGAVYGLGMLGLVVLVNALKYPAFRFAPLYVAATGRSLVTGYARRGRTVLLLYGVTFLPTLCSVMAALAITLAGLLTAVLDLRQPPPVLGCAIVVAAVVITLAGGYRLLDRLTKGFVAFLTLATLAATVAVLPRIEWQFAALAPPPMTLQNVAFLVALAGFMPAGLDLSVMHSLWSVARVRQTGYRPPLALAMVDFNIGYGASLVLALCFVLMGTGVMHGAGTVPEAAAPAFAAQVIDLYVQTLGPWSGALVGASAFAVLLTTLLAITDGFPRVMAAVGRELMLRPPRREAPQGGPAAVRAGDAADAGDGGRGDPLYLGAMLFAAVSAIVLLLRFPGSFRAFIDVVTTLGFVTSPVIALLNHLAVTGADVPPALRPGIVLRAWSLCGIAALLAAGIAYGILSLGGSPA